MARITFEDKVATRTSTLPIVNQIRDVDLNELKNGVNELYDKATWVVELDSTFERAFTQPYAQAIKITATSSNVSQAIEIEVESYPYTLGDTINQWMEIKVIGEVESTVNLSVESVL